MHRTLTDGPRIKRMSLKPRERCCPGCLKPGPLELCERCVKIHRAYAGIENRKAQMEWIG